MSFPDLLPSVSFAAAASPVPATGFESNPFVLWAEWYLVTLAFELPMVLAAWRFRGCQGPLRPWLIACIAGNLLTHPAAVYLSEKLDLHAGGVAAVTNYIIIETAVIAVEAWAYRYRATNSWTEAAIVALVANATTAVLGAYLFFWT